MTLKNFRIHYKRRCTISTYKHYQDIKAVSEKMAIKKFWSYKEFGSDRSNKQSMEYERDALGFQWFDIKAELLPVQ